MDSWPLRFRTGYPRVNPSRCRRSVRRILCWPLNVRLRPTCFYQNLLSAGRPSRSFSSRACCCSCFSFSEAARRRAHRSSSSAFFFFFSSALRSRSAISSGVNGLLGFDAVGFEAEGRLSRLDRFACCSPPPSSGASAKSHKPCHARDQHERSCRAGQRDSIRFFSSGIGDKAGTHQTNKDRHQRRVLTGSGKSPQLQTQQRKDRGDDGQANHEHTGRLEPLVGLVHFSFMLFGLLLPAVERIAFGNVLM